MASLDRIGAVPLGQQAVPVTKVMLVPAHAVDVKEGRLPMGVGDHYLQVVNLSTGEAWLLPVTVAFLRTLGRNCQQAGGIAQPTRENEA